MNFCGPGQRNRLATRYGLEGPEIESWWWRDFSHPSRPALGPTQPLIRQIEDPQPEIKIIYIPLIEYYKKRGRQ
jgi:hypothetical protein